MLQSVCVVATVEQVVNRSKAALIQNPVDSMFLCCADQPSLYLFPVDHPVRQFAHKVANSCRFQNISLVLVLMSCVLLAVENPHSQTRRPVFQWLELLSMLFFLFEAAVEVIDSTLVYYLKHWTKVTDLVVVANTTVSLFVHFHGVQVCPGLLHLHQDCAPRWKSCILPQQGECISL